MRHSLQLILLAAVITATSIVGFRTADDGVLAQNKPAGAQAGQKIPTPTVEPAVSDETVRLSTELVNVLFTAIDENNRLITDLTQQDVTISEDGIRQRVFTFKKEATLPISIAILIDLSGSQEFTFPQEKRAAAEFLRSILRAGKDSGAVLAFREDVDLLQGLTTRIDLLNRSLEELEFSRRLGAATSRSQATALYDAIYITVDEVLGRDIRRTTGEDSIRRRAVILLTDGADNASSRKLSEALDRAWRSGVAIYSVGIGDRFRFEGIQEDVLRRISDETGGRAFFPHGPDELLDDFRKIENDLRSQYLIAYEPTNTKKDGSFRRIEVELANRSKVQVVHRRGYYAPMDDVRK